VATKQTLAFLAVFVYATHATQATAFEWKPGFSQLPFDLSSPCVPVQSILSGQSKSLHILSTTIPPCLSWASPMSNSISIVVQRLLITVIIIIIIIIILTIQFLGYRLFQWSGPQHRFVTVRTERSILFSSDYPLLCSATMQSCCMRVSQESMIRTSSSSKNFRFNLFFLTLGILTTQAI